MLQNLKIDIIYYETPSDFEFEFNLGGCCHCRVLNNTTSSPKELISCLSKAVGRSRVIIVVGNLNKQNGLYLLISKAIGRQLEEVSADQYGIIEGSDNTVIEGSLPLVSSDGLLAGCIIESGPQSIILLPDEKTLRKDIAENLVFQYISAVSRTPETDSVLTSDSQPKEQETKDEVIEEQVEEKVIPESETFEEPEVSNEINNEEDVLTSVEEIFEEAKEVEEESVITENNDIKEVIITENDDDFFDIFAEETEEKSEQEFVYANNSDNEYENAENFEQNISPKDKGLNLLIWIIIGLMFIIIGVLAYMLIYTPLKNGVNITDYITQIFNQ